MDNFLFDIQISFKFSINAKKIRNLIIIMQNNTNSISEEKLSLICMYDQY